MKKIIFILAITIAFAYAAQAQQSFSSMATAFCTVDSTTGLQFYGRARNKEIASQLAVKNCEEISAVKGGFCLVETLTCQIDY